MLKTIDLYMKMSYKCERKAILGTWWKEINGQYVENDIRMAKRTHEKELSDIEDEGCKFKQK